MALDHSDYKPICPYAERIVRAEVIITNLMPLNFREDFTKMSVTVTQIYNDLHGNGEKGICERVDNLELSQARAIGAAGVIGAVVGFLSSYLQRLFN